jgi:hypothetical protein
MSLVVLPRVLPRKVHLRLLFHLLPHPEAKAPQQAVRSVAFHCQTHHTFANWLVALIQKACVLPAQRPIPSGP